MLAIGRRLLLVIAVGAGGPAAAEKGVTSGEVLLGMPAAFTGPSRELGREFWRGAQAAFAAANARGGVHGRSVRLVTEDDAYSYERAVPAALRLIHRRNVFALFGGVGTPTLARVLPVLLKYHRGERLFYFSNFTGAGAQRQAPYDEAVFNVRASYAAEVRAIVDVFVEMGLTRVGLFLQADAYGDAGKSAAVAALRAHGLAPAVVTSYPRGMKVTERADAQVRALTEARVDAVIAVGAYQACAALVRDLRLAGSDAPIHNLSFVGADALLALVRDEETRLGRPLHDRLINTQVVPYYGDAQLEAVREYRAAMDRYGQTPPPGTVPQEAVSLRPYGFVSFEGYVSARAFLAVLERVGPDLTRQSFIDAAESMGSFDLGLGRPAELSARRHQALDAVWYTVATPQGWRSTPDPAAVLAR